MNKNVRFRAEPPPDYDDPEPGYDYNGREPASKYRSQTDAVGPYEELPGMGEAKWEDRHALIKSKIDKHGQTEFMTCKDVLYSIVQRTL